MAIEPGVSFKRFTQGDGSDKKHYFVMCTLHEDESDFEDSALDLVVTSEHKCWQAEGIFSVGMPRIPRVRFKYSEIL